MHACLQGKKTVTESSKSVQYLLKGYMYPWA